MISVGKALQIPFRVDTGSGLQGMSSLGSGLRMQNTFSTFQYIILDLNIILTPLDFLRSSRSDAQAHSSLGSMAPRKAWRQSVPRRWGSSMLPGIGYTSLEIRRGRCRSPHSLPILPGIFEGISIVMGVPPIAGWLSAWKIPSRSG